MAILIARLASVILLDLFLTAAMVTSTMYLPEAQTLYTAPMAPSSLRLFVSASQSSAASPVVPNGPDVVIGVPSYLDGPYLFLDDALIDESRSSGYELTPRPPEIRGRVVAPDTGWEAMGYHYWSQVIEVPEGYRLYYRRVPVDDADAAGAYCVAHSADGVHWTKPVLGGSKFRGLNTNCTENGYQYVFYDPNSRANRPYKKLGHLDDVAFGITGSSSDGLTFIRKQVLLLPFFADSQNVAIWDDALDRYLLFLRGRNEEGGRTVVRAETPSLNGVLDYAAEPENEPRPGRDYPPIVSELPTILAADSADWRDWQVPQPGMVDIYHNAAFKYPWARGVYLAFPNLYYHYSSQTTPPALSGNDGEFEVQLATSRDSKSWSRYRAPYVARGEMDGEQMLMMSMGQGMIRRGNELYQYFIALPRSHAFGAWFGDEWRWIMQDESTKAEWMSGEKGGVYLAVSQLHRFVSLHAGETESVVTTKPFLFQGNRLALNYITGPEGSVCAALLDKAGREIPGNGMGLCDPLQGDGFEQVVSWQGQSDLSAYSGQEVRLRFRLTRADLFAFEFQGDPYPADGPAPLVEQWRETFDQGYGQLTQVVGRDLWSVESGKLAGAFDRDGTLKERARLLEAPLTEGDGFAFEFDFRLLSGQRVLDAGALIGLMGDGQLGRNPLLALWVDDGGRQWGISAGANGSEGRLGGGSRVSPDLGLWPNEDDWLRARLLWNPDTQTATATLWNLDEGWRIGSTAVELGGIEFTLDRAGVRMDMPAFDPDLVLEMDNMVFSLAEERPTPTPSPTPSPTPTETPTPSPTPSPTLTPTSTATATPSVTDTPTPTSTPTAFLPPPLYLPILLWPSSGRF